MTINMYCRIGLDQDVMAAFCSVKDSMLFWMFCPTVLCSGRNASWTELQREHREITTHWQMTEAATTVYSDKYYIFLAPVYIINTYI